MIVTITVVITITVVVTIAVIVMMSISHDNFEPVLCLHQLFANPNIQIAALTFLVVVSRKPKNEFQSGHDIVPNMNPLARPPLIKRRKMFIVMFI